MNQQYSSTIKDHYHNPRNAGKLDHADFVAEQINPLCGDEIKVYIKFTKFQNARDREHFGQSKIVQDISHETRGCMICVASASVVSEFARGKKIDKIKELSVQQIAEFLDVSISPARAQCAELFLRAVRSF